MEIDIFKINIINIDIINYYKNNVDIAKEDYNKLTTNNRGLDKSKFKGNFEIHHILPKCLGGTNDENNLVLLTYEEHVKAHMLLYIIYPEETKLLGAFKLLITVKDRLSKMDNLNIDLIMLTEIRKEFSESMKGENNPSKRPEVREKISKNNPMKKLENRLKFMGDNNPMKKLENRLKFMGDNSPMRRPEVKAKITGENNPSKRLEVREKISKNLKGKKFSEEHKKNLQKSRAKIHSIQGPDGTIYESASIAAKILGLHQSTINRWVKKEKNGFKRIKQ